MVPGVVQGTTCLAMGRTVMSCWLRQVQRAGGSNSGSWVRPLTTFRWGIVTAENPQTRSKRERVILAWCLFLSHFCEAWPNLSCCSSWVSVGCRCVFPRTPLPSLSGTSSSGYYHSLAIKTSHILNKPHLSQATSQTRSCSSWSGSQEDPSQLVKITETSSGTETKWLRGAGIHHSLIECISFSPTPGPLSHVSTFFIAPPSAPLLKLETQDSWLTPLPPLPQSSNQLITRFGPNFLLNTCQSHVLVSIPSAIISAQAQIMSLDCGNSLLLPVLPATPLHPIYDLLSSQSDLSQTNLFPSLHSQHLQCLLWSLDEASALQWLWCPSW